MKYRVSANMRPEQEFTRRELVKEYHRRVRYIKTRLKDMPIEQKFIEGKLNALPTYISPMPKWAMAAVIESGEGIAKPIEHLKPQPGQKYTAHQLIELLGYFQAMVAYVQNPNTEVARLEKEAPGLSPIRTRLNKQVAKALLSFCRAIRRKKSEPAYLPSVEELIRRQRKFVEGMENFISPDGQVRSLRTQTTRIIFLLWMFRHELEGHFTTPYIHSWLKKEHGESPSDSLVEAIVTKLRKGPRVLPQP